ncbi:MAG: hypothetical protein ACLPKB_32860 [Xanthobacteraceae bacterium]
MWKLRRRPFNWNEPALTEEERRELARLDARLVAEHSAIAAAERRARPGRIETFAASGLSPNSTC